MRKNLCRHRDSIPQPSDPSLQLSADFPSLRQYRPSTVFNQRWPLIGSLLPGRCSSARTWRTGWSATRPPRRRWKARTFGTCSEARSRTGPEPRPEHHLSSFNHFSNLPRFIFLKYFHLKRVYFLMLWIFVKFNRASRFGFVEEGTSASASASKATTTTTTLTLTTKATNFHFPLYSWSAFRKIIDSKK